LLTNRNQRNIWRSKRRIFLFDVVCIAGSSDIAKDYSCIEDKLLHKSEVAIE
jgi:hypothetical protein